MPLSRIQWRVLQLRGKKWKGRIKEHVRQIVQTAILPSAVLLMMTALWGHSSSKYYTLFPSSGSVSASLFPAISSYQMPHVALSAFVIDRHVRWQIDHCSGPGFSSSGPQPHHYHYSLWPIDPPWQVAPWLGVPTKKESFFFFSFDTPFLCQRLCHQPCSQLSRLRTIRLMFPLICFMSPWSFVLVFKDSMYDTSINKSFSKL